MLDLRRREFIIVLGGAASWPLAARAQQPAMSVVGFLNSVSPGPFARMVAGFQQGLREAGYVEGQNVTVIRASRSGFGPSPPERNLGGSNRPGKPRCALNGR